MLRRLAALYRPLRPVLLLVSFPRSRGPVVGVLGLCWLRRVLFVRQRCPIVGVPGLRWLLRGSSAPPCHNMGHVLVQGANLREHAVAVFGQARVTARHVPRNTCCRQKPGRPMTIQSNRPADTPEHTNAWKYSNTLPPAGTLPAACLSDGNGKNDGSKKCGTTGSPCLADGGMFAQRAPGACPAHCLCIKYLISAPKCILTLGSPPSRPHWTANLPCKAPCITRNMRIQQHKMSLPPLPTTTLAIVMNWVQRMGQILRHGEKVLQIVW